MFNLSRAAHAGHLALRGIQGPATQDLAEIGFKPRFVRDPTIHDDWEVGRWHLRVPTPVMIGLDTWRGFAHDGFY